MIIIWKIGDRNKMVDMKDIQSYSSHAVLYMISEYITLSAASCATLLLALYLAMKSFYYRFW